jgi:hypothetical protein
LAVFRYQYGGVVAMKKAFGLFLILAVAGWGFAQELRFNGSISSGLWAVLSQDSVEDPVVRLQTTQDDLLGYRVELLGTYKGEEENSGLAFRLRAQDDLQFPAYNNGFYAYAWFTALDDKLKVLAGFIDDGTFATAGGISDDAGEGTGAMAIFSVAGLDLGVGIFAPKADVKAKNAKYRFDAAYTIEDILKINAGYAIHAKPQTVDDVKDSLFFAGLSVLALNDLGLSTLAVDAELSNIGAEKGLYGQTVVIGEQVVFEKAGLTVGLRAEQKTKNEAETIFGMRFPLWVSYEINDSIEPRFDIGYSIGSAALNPNYRLEGRNALGLDVTKDASSFMAGLSVAFTIGTATFTPGFQYIADLSKNDALDPKISAFIDFTLSF